MLKKKNQNHFAAKTVFLLLLAITLHAQNARAVIYGEDDRTDYYQLTNPSIISAADSVVALMDASDIICYDIDCFLLNLQSLAEWYLETDPIATGNPLCSDQPYLDEPTPAFCSGFMIADDLILTAGHCIDDSTCKDTAFVFGFHMADVNSPVTTFPLDDVYYGSEIIARDSSGANDWAIVKVDRPIVGRQPLPIRTEGLIEDEAPLVVIGHPVGLPTKIDSAPEVLDNSHPDYFELNSDTFGGNSGSAVFGEDADGSVTRVEGILVRGFDEFDFTTDANGLCDRLIECPNEGCPELEKAVRTINFADFVPQKYIAVFTDQNSKDNAVSSAAFPINHNYSIIPGFAASLDNWQRDLLLTEPNLKYLEPDSPRGISKKSKASTPTDPGPDETIPYGIDKIQAPAVWPITTGAGAIVAVLDSGIDTNHPDFAGTTFLPGYNAADESLNIDDECGHGTHVAGTVAATADNGLGVAGAASGASIIPVRFLDSEGSGYTSDVISGIEYAAAHGTRVINMSFGDYSFSQSEHDALQNAAAAGILLIAPIGDANSDQPYYPPDYNCVLAVSAIDINDTKADFSNYSPTADHVAAPGVEILSTTPGGYETRSSTDMAAAHVSGLAALLFAAEPAATEKLIRKAILQTAIDLGAPGPDTIYGRGLVNAPNALAYLLAAGIPADCAQVHDFGYAPLPDLDEDCFVSLADLKIFADHWLNENCSDQNLWCGQTDFTASGSVNFPDFAEFANSWLSCNDPQQINCAPCSPNWP